MKFENDIKVSFDMMVDLIRDPKQDICIKASNFADDVYLVQARVSVIQHKSSDDEPYTYKLCVVGLRVNPKDVVVDENTPVSVIPLGELYTTEQLKSHTYTDMTVESADSVYEGNIIHDAYEKEQRH